MHESGRWKWSRSVVSDSLRPHGLQPTRLLCPWDFLGKSTGVGCHCLLHGLLHFFLFLVDIHHDEVFFLLLILATNTPLPHFVLQTWSACLRSEASRVWGSSGELVPRQEWLLHWRLCHSAALGHVKASRHCQVPPQLLLLVAILIILSLPKNERGMSFHLFSSSLFSFNKSSFVFLFVFLILLNLNLSIYSFGCIVNGIALLIPILNCLILIVSV